MLSIWIIFIFKIWLTLNSSVFDMFKAICLTNTKSWERFKWLKWDPGGSVSFPLTWEYVAQIWKLLDGKCHPCCSHYLISVTSVIETSPHLLWEINCFRILEAFVYLATSFLLNLEVAVNFVVRCGASSVAFTVGSQSWGWERKERHFSIFPRQGKRT